MLQIFDLAQDVFATAEHLIELAFAEDFGEIGDITTQAVFAEAQTKTGQAVIIAKSAGVAAGLNILARVFAKVDPPVQVNLRTQDKETITPRQEVVRLHGSTASILSGERVALNFLQRLSGIATFTKKFVDAVAGTRANILDTRKTTPGWRVLEKYAVQCGGGYNHRLGLHDMFLIKENHIAAAGSIAAAVRQCREFAQRHGRQWPLEVETKTLAEVEECLRLGVKHIMLDNMAISEIKKAAKLVGGRAVLEASGNVNLENVAAIAAAGVDYISIGALTHSAPAMDFSLLLAESSK
ncbi:MAG: carboxylating nicotinate-nucleotide diphosphorylase [candidate division KSB1 bacterium]|nr:carboxylating nicotinate-nucleotide diphosphorylase [candidate division KSB1 bacterium]